MPLIERSHRTSTSWSRTWRSAETRVIRVPAALADKLLHLAHVLDDGGQVQAVPAARTSGRPQETTCDRCGCTVQVPPTGPIPHFCGVACRTAARAERKTAEQLEARPSGAATSLDLAGSPARRLSPQRR